MTAEVAVMNAQAVALAADSAVSIEGRAKTFTSAEKIFRLSGWEPIALMIHGNASFMGIPWETIAKSYRRKLATDSFETLAEYANDFVEYVKREAASLITPQAQEKQARNEIRARLTKCFDVFEGMVQQRLSEEGSIPGWRLPIYLEQAVLAEHRDWSKLAVLVPGLSGAAARVLIAKYQNDARLVQEEVFRDFPLTEAVRPLLHELCGFYLTRMMPGDDVSHTTGIVFAGFGTKEFFPHVIEYAFDGYVGDTLRWVERNAWEVSLTQRADVIAFAQQDMVKAFMHGIDPEFKDEISDSVQTFITEYSDAVLDAVPAIDARSREKLKSEFKRIGKEAFVQFRKSLKEWRRRKSSESTLGVIHFLPKDELATVAESLVSLTLLKARVSMDESVSPPIDVCVVSKHDGFVWVKKKHYFPGDLNPHFTDRDKHILRLQGGEYGYQKSGDPGHRGDDGKGTRVVLPESDGDPPSISPTRSGDD
jgi:hypothetical protein